MNNTKIKAWFFCIVMALSTILFTSGCMSTYRGDVSTSQVMPSSGQISRNNTSPYYKFNSKCRRLGKQIAEAGDDKDKILSVCKAFFREIKTFRLTHLSDAKAQKRADSILKCINAVYSRTQFKKKNELFYNNMMSAESAEERIASAEKLRILIKETLKHKDIWNSADRKAIKDIQKEADWIYFGENCRQALTIANDVFIKTSDPEVAMNACKKAEKAIKDLLKKDELLTSSTRKHLRGIMSKFQYKYKKTNAEFTVLIHKAQENLRRMQELFADKQASQDIKAAKKILSCNRNKIVNWWVLGYPRDDSYQLYRGEKLCERVLRSKYVGYLLKHTAAQVKNQILSRFSSSEKKVCASFPVPLRYVQLATFPKWDPKNRAKKEWGKIHQNQYDVPEKLL
jgi:hypothetical protein